MTLHQKEGLEKKLSSLICLKTRLSNRIFILETYEKQMRTVASENEKFKQYFQQMERALGQFKQENEDLQLKVKDNRRMNSILICLIS